MRQIHDIDVIILLATMLSSKRRPAELVEIVAAADLLQGFIPSKEKFGVVFQRLSTLGLINARDGAYALTPMGQKIIAKQPINAADEGLISALKSDLSVYRPKEEYPPIHLSDEQLSTAIRVHKLARKTPGKNLLMPKPKLDRYFKVEGRWRKVSAIRSVKPGS